MANTPDDAPNETPKRFTLTFSMENEAFQNRKTAHEINRILSVVAGHIATGRFSGKVYDFNGNHVGEFDATWRQEP